MVARNTLASDVRLHWREDNRGIIVGIQVSQDNIKYFILTCWFANYLLQFQIVVQKLRNIVKTPTLTPTQHNTTVGFDTKMTVQTTPPPQALLDELES